MSRFSGWTLRRSRKPRSRAKHKRGNCSLEKRAVAAFEFACHSEPYYRVIGVGWRAANRPCLHTVQTTIKYHYPRLRRFIILHERCFTNRASAGAEIISCLAILLPTALTIRVQETDYPHYTCKTPRPYFQVSRLICRSAYNLHPLQSANR